MLFGNSKRIEALERSFYVSQLRIARFMEVIVQGLNEIQAAIAEQKTVVDSVVTLIDELIQHIEQNAGDSEAIGRTLTDLRTQKEALAKAVAKGTAAENEQHEFDPSANKDPNVVGG
jgi:methyl-accepting chemotaxis protein